MSNQYQYKEDYAAMYISLTKSFGQKFQAVAGIRGEGIDYSSANLSTKQKIDSNYIGLFPNLSLQYTVNTKNNFSFSLAKKTKRPALKLLFPGRTYYNPTYYNENNPFLQPVNIYSLDMMYVYQNKYYFSGGSQDAKNQYARFVVPLAENEKLFLKRTYLNTHGAGSYRTLVEGLNSFRKEREFEQK